MKNICNSFNYYVLTLILFILNIIFVIVGIVNSGFVNVFIQALILFMTTVVYFSISASIKNEDFTIIAGYDKNVEYNMSVMKVLLHTIVKFVTLAGLIYTLIFTVLGIINLPNKALISVILCMFFLIDFVGCFVLINYSFADQLYKDKVIIRISKKSLIVISIFVGLILICIGVVIFLMEYYNIENNTADAFKLVFFIFLYLISALIGFFYEQSIINKAIKNKSSYTYSKLFYISIAICLVILVIMFIAAMSF